MAGPPAHGERARRPEPRSGHATSGAACSLPPISRAVNLQGRHRHGALPPPPPTSAKVRPKRVGVKEVAGRPAGRKRHLRPHMRCRRRRSIVAIHLLGMQLPPPDVAGPVFLHPPLSLALSLSWRGPSCWPACRHRQKSPAVTAEAALPHGTTTSWRARPCGRVAPWCASTPRALGMAKSSALRLGPTSPTKSWSSCPA